MINPFTINAAALRSFLEQSLLAIEGGIQVDDLSFLTPTWNPNDFPDSQNVGALLRAVHSAELIQGAEGMTISYIEEDFDGSGSYAFFVEHPHQYDSVRVLSTFG